MADTDSSEPAKPRIQFGDDTFTVDAELIGELLRMPASRVQSLMREGKITTACERGIDEHEGEFILSWQPSCKGEYGSVRPHHPQIGRRY